MVTDIKDRTFDFSVRVVRLCQLLNAAPGASRTVANQLLRSGTSIGANVEEAHGSQSKADFIAKMYIACKEARETHYWLRLLIATELVPEAKLLPLLDESNQLVAILTTIVKKARQSGPKHA
ncbi:MAG: four helix bundle protein [Xanthomonadaceae bacterium]|nr:four helix bundle protein [Xanthomonadaceae bacterium]MDP2186151.1 four helix bundle protein [Xanthomonadales bacterium]MDZ4115890.1 four helix bundle protein [Xanthomonadaceae bacterium]MDZ4377193.1 four helix bundle protein [Xanthomonadaceae bacterium]